MSNDTEFLSISTPSEVAQLKNKMQRGENVQLNNLFGGKRKSKKGSKKGSRKGSKKMSWGGKRKSSKKGSRKSRKGSKRMSGGKRRSAKKGSRKSRKGSRISRKGSRKSRKGSRKSRKGSRKSSSRMAEGEQPAKKKGSQLEGFRNLVKHIQGKMGLKFGPVLLKLAGMYNNAAKNKFPGLSPEQTAKKAEEIFNNDSADERKKKHAEAEKLIAEKKASK